MLFTSIKEINMLKKENSFLSKGINKLRREVNRLLSKGINTFRKKTGRLLRKGMSNIYLKVTIEKN